MTAFFHLQSICPVENMEIGLTTTPFDYLLQEKTAIDIHLDEPMWDHLQVGDVVTYKEDLLTEPSMTEEDIDKSITPRYIRARITELIRTKTFEDLIYTHEEFFKINTDGKIKELKKWWSNEEIEKHSILGIKVELL